MTVRWRWEHPEPDVDRERLNALRERIDHHIALHKWRHVTLLCDLLREPTISGADDRAGQERYREAIDACLARLARESERLGLEWREHDGAAAIAQWTGRNGQQGSVGMAGHIDVVPADGPWQYPPFAGTVHDGSVWGRGAQDDKGGIAAGIAAMDVLQQMGLEPRSDIRVLIGTLEETDDWSDMDLLLEREHAPDVTLVPDGAFPVIVGEKGMVSVNWHATWNEEATHGLRFLGLSGGTRHNLVPDRAVIWVACRAGEAEATRERLHRLAPQAQVQNAREPPPTAEGDPCFELVFHGKCAHGAFPRDGLNAVLDALRAVLEIFGHHGPGHFARLLLESCARTDGSGLRLDHTHPRMGPTTVNLGVARFGLTNAHAHINIRFPLGLSLDQVNARLLETTRSVRAPLRVQHMTLGRPHEPLYNDPDEHPGLIHTLQSAYRTGTGRTPTLATIAGTTYAKVFPLGIPFGPQDESAGEPILAHQSDERVTLDRFTENIRVYALALAMLAFDQDEPEPVHDGEH